MKRIVVLILLMLCGSLQAQRRIDGIYMGVPEYKYIQGLTSHEDYIIVSGDRFIYMIPQYSHPIRANDTITDCTYKWVDNEFIELNNDESLSDVLHAATTIRQTYDSKIHEDSVVMQFDLGMKWWYMVAINVYTDAAVEPYGIEDLSNKLKTILLPCDFDSFHFDILKAILWDNNFIEPYILLRCESPVYVRDAGANFIEVKVHLNDLYDKIYIHNDFAQVKGRNIIWNGRKYRKISERKNILGFGALKDYY